MIHSCILTYSDVNISFLATWFTVALTLLLTSYFIASWFTVAFQLMWRQSFIPCLLIHSWLWSYSDINFPYFFWRQHFTLMIHPLGEEKTQYCPTPSSPTQNRPSGARDYNHSLSKADTVTAEGKWGSDVLPVCSAFFLLSSWTCINNLPFHISQL